MKQAEIQIGGEYLTKVSGTLVRVRVTARREVQAYAWSNDPRRKSVFDVVRVDNGRALHGRSAAALRPARPQ